MQLSDICPKTMAQSTETGGHLGFKPLGDLRRRVLLGHLQLYEGLRAPYAPNVTYRCYFTDRSELFAKRHFLLEAKVLLTEPAAQ